MVPTISVVKWASAAQAEPGGAFTFTVLVTNNSTEGVTVTSIDDAPYGNLLDAANPAVANNTCPTIAGATITPGGGTQLHLRRQLHERRRLLRHRHRGGDRR